MAEAEVKAFEEVFSSRQVKALTLNNDANVMLANSLNNISP